MLSAKKVKLHGISDDKWTVKDKVSQYKGLISLCRRDNKLLQIDLSRTKRQKGRLIHELSRDIVRSRKDLEDAIAGDKQNLRNALQEHKDLLLAFQHLSPEKAAENVHQSNFNKRKELDRLKFQMRLRKERLIEEKLKLAGLEDRETYADLFGHLASEQQAQRITGKVQDALLKQEAAIAVRYTYKRILDLLRNDTHYYDAVLNALRLDLGKQNGCLHRITELGQLATENLDDRNDELKQVEYTVKLRKDEMNRSIDAIKLQVTNVAENVKSLIRRDSDINLPKKDLIKKQSDEALMVDVSEFEHILNQLQMVVMVPTYESLYPCLITQKKHEEQLSLLANNLRKDTARLTTKKVHAEIKLNSLYYSMVDTTLAYMNKKKELTEQIAAKRDQLSSMRQAIKGKGLIVIQIRASLQQIRDMMSRVAGETRSVAYRSTLTETTNEDKLLAEVTSKLKSLMAVVPSQLAGKAMEDARVLYMEMVTGTCNIIDVTESVTVEDILDSVTLEDANIYTRADVKKMSREIVEHNLALEQEMFMATPPKKKR